MLVIGSTKATAAADQEAVRYLISLFAELCGLGATVPVVDMTFGIVQGTRNLL